MTVTILDSQIRLIVSDGQAKPDVFINPIGHVIFHLTQGFNSSTFPIGQGDALTDGAHVPLGGNPGSNDFAFIQIARLTLGVPSALANPERG
jgi:hypothetical protein